MRERLYFCLIKYDDYQVLFFNIFFSMIKDY